MSLPLPAECSSHQSVPSPDEMPLVAPCAQARTETPAPAPGASAPLPSLYVAHAYRWGSVNDHHYFVAAGSDREQMMRVAEQARDERGGKYGVELVQTSQPGTRPFVHERIAYFCSMARESGPEEDAAREAARALGFRLVEVLEHNAVDVPDKEIAPGAFTLRKAPVAVPRWLREFALEVLEREVLAYPQDASLIARVRRGAPSSPRDSGAD